MSEVVPMTKPKRSKLLGVAPEVVKPSKPKVLLFGGAGVGKTWHAMDFPSVFYIDPEGGATREQYQAKLKASGGTYFGPDQGARELDGIIEQVEALAVEQHAHKTIVIDSITKPWMTAISDEQAKLGTRDVFGASKKNPIKQMHRLLKWLNRADMNVLIICHQKDLWGKNARGDREVVGATFDAWEKLEYELDLVLRISKDSDGRWANIGKSRMLGFPEGGAFEWSYAEFAKRYGRDIIEKETVPIVLATPEQVAELNRLLDIVKLAEGVTDKWLTKAGVDSFEEMSSDQVEACLAFVKGKLT